MIHKPPHKPAHAPATAGEQSVAVVFRVPIRIARQIVDRILHVSISIGAEAIHQRGTPLPVFIALNRHPFRLV
jgi:hypothetical protein